MKRSNKPSVLTIIIILIIFTIYSVVTFPAPKNDKYSSDSLSPVLDHPDPSFPTLKRIKFDSLPEPGEFWEMIRTTDYSDKNPNDRQNFGTMAYFTPVWFNNAYNKFGPHIRYNRKEDIDQMYKNREWYEICYLDTCMNVVFRQY